MRSFASPTGLNRHFELPFNPWWALWVAAIAAPWLLPTHLIPWGAFHADLLMAIALLPGAVWAIVQSRRPVPVPAGAVLAFVVAGIPPIQLAAGMMLFAGNAWIASIYLLGFAIAWVVGARFTQTGRETLGDVLFAAFGIASLLSVGIVLYQWLHLSGLGLLILNFPYVGGYRPFGNLGQPNHLATLFVWGLVALWWAFLSGRARGWIVTAAAAFILFGIAATQSRTAWLELALLGGVAVLYRKPLRSGGYYKTLVLLGALAVVLALGWDEVNRALLLTSSRSVASEISPGLRPAAWRLFLDAITLRPWFGWGWNQIAMAQSAVALDHPTLRYTFESTHDLVLDLLIQNGVPIGGLVVLALGAWMYSKARRVDSPQACLLLAAVAVLLVHAMLEFPQDYAYFLLPAGLMIGALDTLHPIGRPVPIGRWVAAGVVTLAALATGWVAVEYNVAERNLEQLRFERARVGPNRHSQAPDLHLLTQLREFLRVLRYRPEVGMTSAQLEDIRKVTLQFPSDGNQLMYAASAGLNGRPEVARDALTRMCRMVPPQRCLDALSTWRSIAASSPALRAIAVPAGP